MSDPYVVDIGSGKAGPRPFTDAERAEFEAFQADKAARAAAEDAARAEIIFGADIDDLRDPTRRKALVLSHSKFLSDTQGSQDPVVIQMRRLTRGQLSLIRAVF